MPDPTNRPVVAHFQQTLQKYLEANKRNARELIAKKAKSFTIEAYKGMKAVAPTPAKIKADVLALGWRVKRKAGAWPYKKGEKRGSKGPLNRMRASVIRRRQRAIGSAASGYIPAMQALGASPTRQNQLVREGLRGNETQMRIKELQAARQREIAALEDSTANNPQNKAAIEERYRAQIGAEREMGRFREKQYQRDSQALGINRSLSTDEEKRVRLIQQEVDGLNDQLRTGKFINDEQRQALNIQLGQKQQELRVATADAKIAESQFHLAQQTVGVNATNLSVRARAYQTELATLSALREQYDAVAKLNTTKARGLEISIDENENAVRLMRQDALYGKSNSEIRQQIQRDRMDKINRDKFDKKQDRNDGLIDLHRGMDGSIIDGLDPLTGERRARRAGAGRGEQGLHTGSLSDKPMSTTAGASLTRDADPNGGLSTGSGGMRFGDADLFQQRHNALVASGFINRASVADRLADPTAHGFGDPIATMNRAPIFPSLSGTLNDARKAQNRVASPAAILKSSLDQHVLMNSKMDKLIQGVQKLRDIRFA